MARLCFARTWVAVSLVISVAGCGGGGGGGGDGNAPTLSALQGVYESAALASNGGIHNVLWSMPDTGMPSSCPTPPTRNCSFIVDESSGGLAASPLTAGKQTETSAWVSMSTSLAVPALPLNVDTPAATGDIPAAGPTLRLPELVVKGGQILLVADPEVRQVSYVGDTIRIDHLAAGGATVAYGETVTSMNVVNVSGTVAGVGGEIGLWLNRHRLVSNPAMLKTATTFRAGAAWLKSTCTRTGDTLFTADCALSQTSLAPASLVPCQAGKSLGDLTTINNYYDGSGGSARTYTLAADGTICEIAAQATGTACPPFGVRYWVSTSPRPAGANVPPTIEAYRVFYELNGNVYTGTLQRDGTALRTNVGSDAAPNLQPFVIRVNKAFADSLKDALAF